MSSFSKWLGAGIGFVAGGPIGAVIGFVAGSVVDAYSKEDFVLAEELLEDYHSQFKDTLSLFYKGIAQLGQAEPDKALETFSTFQNLTTLLQEQTKWYRVLAYLKKNDRMGIQNTITLMKDSKYKIQASQILEKLEKSTTDEN